MCEREICLMMVYANDNKCAIKYTLFEIDYDSEKDDR